MTAHTERKREGKEERGRREREGGVSCVDDILGSTEQASYV